MTTWHDPETARQVVDQARRWARVDALHDIDRLRGTAVDNGRDQAERLIQTSLRRPGSQTVRRNPAGGLLRDWYTTVYTAELNATLTGAGTVPGAAEVEQTTVELHQRTPQRDAKEAFRAVTLLYRLAREDAAVAATTVYDELNATAQSRAVDYTDQTVEADPIRTPILRHWYQRCYRDTIGAALGLQRPLEVVTHVEATQVAACVRSGEWIIGADDIPLATAIGVAVDTRRSDPGARNRTLRARITGLWEELDWPGRIEWLRAGGRRCCPRRRWSQIPGAQQAALISHWFDTHRQDAATQQPVDDIVVDGDLAADPRQRVIAGPTAAAEMFHQKPRVHQYDVGHGHDGPDR